ncbi:MAG: glycosyltransferase [Lachnospiraceae bacterium]|nr:glycosyltransferase [Lachnospiraceae bacterium]
MFDVIIPVYKPTQKLMTLFYYLNRQTVKPDKVIVINTEKEYWDAFFDPFDILKKYPFLEVHHIKKDDFDHGNTRNYGVSFSKAEFFLMMTDDAVPADENMAENLLKAFDNDKVGMSYAKQLPHKGCNAIEKYTRSFNYPNESKIKGIDDLETLGIKTFYASNVCCMYRRKFFDEIGGFIKKTIFNEDMIYARNMINKGYLIAYTPSAKVFHSHNFTGKQYFKRNFDLGVSQADNPDIFGDVKSEGEGVKLVKSTAIYLCKKFMPWLVFKLVYHSACKYLGFRYGKRYKKLSDKRVLRYTMSPSYFEKDNW